MSSPPAQSVNAGRLAAVVLAALLAAAVAYQVAFHLRFIMLAGPQEVREAALPLFTRMLLEGGTPYALDTLPAYSNIYGPVYNYAVLPAAMAWGPTFAVHRAASLLFLLAGAALVYAMLRRADAARGWAFCGAAFYYLINGSTYAIVSRPDSLGAALYLASFLVALPRAGTPPGLLKLMMSAALAVLAFYTKPYFASITGLVVLSLLATSGWRRALGYAGITAGFFLATVPLAQHFWPYCLYSLLWVNWASTVHADGFFWKQTADFLLLHAGLLGAFAATGRARSWRDPGTLALAGSTALLILYLGHHAGSFRTYWAQLVTPFLIVAAVRGVMAASGARRALGVVLLAANGIILLTWARMPWPADPAPVWNEWRAFTADHPWQLLPPHLTQDNPAPGAPVLDNGQMIYFANAVLRDLPPGDPARARVEQFAIEARDLLARRKFDLIVTPNDFKFYIPDNLLDEHYDRWLVEFPIYFLHYDEPRWYGAMSQQFTAWVRKPGPEHAPLDSPPAP